MNTENLKDLSVEAIESLKGLEIVVLDVSEKTSIADFLVIATGTSGRHVKSIANEVLVKAKEAGYEALGCEGEDSANWVLVDLGDVIVHVLQKESRDFYELEKLWSVDLASANRQASEE